MKIITTFLKIGLINFSLIFFSLTLLAQSYKDSLNFTKKTEVAGRVQTLRNGHILYDFQQPYFGRLKVDLTNLPKGDSVVVYIGEKADATGQIDRIPGGNIRSYRYVVRKTDQDLVYLPDVADKKNTSGNALRLPAFMGILAPFRYAELETVSAAARINITREVFHYRFDDQASRFRSSDSVLNAIWDLCKHSIKATSFMGLYIDGDRERIPYEADALINQLSHYAVDAEFTMARNTFEYLMEHPTWPTEWHLQMHQVAWYDYQFTGNTSLIKKYYDLLELKTLDAYRQPNGLISTTAVPQRLSFLDSIRYKTFDAKTGLRDITDWPQRGNKVAGPDYNGEADGFVFCAYNSVVNAYHYQSLLLMKEFALVLGKKEDAVAYDRKAKKVYQAFQELFIDKRTGLVKDGDTTSHSSFHANFFALCFGLVPEPNKAAVMQFIVSKDMACSVYGSQFLLDALYREGMGDYGLSMLTKKDERGWYHMLEQGSGMTLEAWDLKFKPNMDWNHAWGAAPANIIAFRMMGIRPATPGFSVAHIQPQVGTLANAEIVLPTINGPIHERVTQTKDYYHVLIKLPAGMKANVELPVFNRDIRTVTVKGSKVRPVLDGGKWKFRQLSGSVEIRMEK